MNSQLPLWLQYAQALTTPAVALFAVIIGMLQWRTAHQKVVLDLFERRMEVYNRLRAVIARATSSGTLTNDEHFEFMRAMDGAKFLFGPEVVQYLADLDVTLGEFHAADAECRDMQGTERAKRLDDRRRYFNKIQGFYVDFEALIFPYVRMHQKLPSF